MLVFKRTNDDEYTLFDGEEKLAFVKVTDNLIKSVSYASEKVDATYGDFTLRSMVLLMRDKHREIKCNFYDERLISLGFEKEGEGMKADSLKIRFDGCCRKGGNQ